MPTPAAPLEYDRSGNHVTRGQFRILLILMFINTVAIVGYVAAPGGMQWARQQWKEFQDRRAAKAREQLARDARAKQVEDAHKALPELAAVKLPPDLPVYTEDGLEAASLLASDTAYKTVEFERQGLGIDKWQPAVVHPGLSPQTAMLRAFLGSANVPNPAMAFCGTRKNLAGAERIVWCELEARQEANQQNSSTYKVLARRTLRVRLIDPGAAEKPPQRLDLVETQFDQRGVDLAEVKTDGTAAPKTPQTFRLLAGVPDAQDATRLRVPYVLNGASGAFVVRVLPNDRLLVEPTDGRIVARRGVSTVEQTWDPHAPPAARISISEGRP